MAKVILKLVLAMEDIGPHLLMLGCQYFELWTCALVMQEHIQAVLSNQVLLRI